jgi:hypothetical protein
MTIVEAPPGIRGGVDTHLDTHVAAALDPLVAGLFPSRFRPRLLTGMTLRRFGLLACTTSPEDLPPSLAQHGSCWRSSTSSSLSSQDTPPR